jgi:hypothetical protein
MDHRDRIARDSPKIAKPRSRSTRACAGQHALVEIERWAGPPPPVTIGSPPPLLPASAAGALRDGGQESGER